MTTRLLTEEEKELLIGLAYKKSADIGKYTELFDNNLSMMARLVRINGLLLNYASPNLKENDEIIEIALKQNPEAVEFAANKYKENKEFIKNLLQTNQTLFRHASEILKNDKEYVLELLKQDYTSMGTLFKYAGDNLKEDRELVMSAVYKKGGNLRFVSPKYQDDEDIVSIAVNNTGYAIRYASDRLKDNRQIGLLAANKSHGTSIEDLSPRLRDDKELILKALVFNDYAFVCASDRLREDKEVVESALRKNPKLFKYVGSNYKNDLSFIVRQLQNIDPDKSDSYNEENDEYDDQKTIDRKFIFNNLTPEFKDDINKMTCLISFDEDCVVYASPRLLDMENFGLVVVSHDGNNLQYLSKNLQNNKFIVMSAILNDSEALQYANEIYKDDIEIIKLVVSNKYNKRAFKYASNNMRSNKELIEYALVINPENILHVSDILANDKNFIIHCMKQLGSIKESHNIYNYLNDNMRAEIEIIKLGLEKNYRNYTFVPERQKESLEIFNYLLNITDNDEYIQKQMTVKMKEQYTQNNYREYVAKTLEVKRLEEKYPEKEDKIKRPKI